MNSNTSMVATGTLQQPFIPWPPSYYGGGVVNDTGYIMVHFDITDPDGNTTANWDGYVAVPAKTWPIHLEQAGGFTYAPWAFCAGMLFGCLLIWLKKIPNLTKFDDRG